MNIEFNKVSEFNRGTIFELLADAYSFDYRCAQRWSSDWKEFGFFVKFGGTSSIVNK